MTTNKRPLPPWTPIPDCPNCSKKHSLAQSRGTKSKTEPFYNSIISDGSQGVLWNKDDYEYPVYQYKVTCGMCGWVYKFLHPTQLKPETVYQEELKKQQQEQK